MIAQDCPVLQYSVQDVDSLRNYNKVRGKSLLETTREFSTVPPP